MISSAANNSETSNHVTDVLRVMASVDGVAKRLEADSKVANDKLHDEQVRLRSTMDITNTKCQKIGDEVEQLRDFILAWMTGSREAFLSLSKTVAPALRFRENPNLHLELVKRLARSPRLLETTFNNSFNAVEMIKIDSYNHRSFFSNCFCRSAQSRSVTRRGRFLVVNESETQHQSNCRCYSGRKRIWRYILAVQLLPLLHRTLAVTFTATRGTGGCSIGVFLNHYRTVDRSKSELFKLFDNLPGTLKKRQVKGVEEGKIVFARTADIDILSHFYELEDPGNAVNELLQSFVELLYHGHGWDKDQHGNTVLHVSALLGYLEYSKFSEKELVYLVLYLGSALNTTHIQLQRVIEMVLAAGIDLLAPAQIGVYRPYLAYDIGCVFSSRSPITLEWYLYSIRLQ